MSKIYIIGGKSEFIDAINHESYEDNQPTTLTFIKKYHGYYSYLSFFPTVLADMIFDYINDIFEIPYMMNVRDDFLHVFFSSKIRLNYENIIINFRIKINHNGQHVWIEQLIDILVQCKCIFLCSHQCIMNYFLQKHYGKVCKNNHECNKYYHNYLNTIIKTINNYKHFKNIIIIIQMIIDFIEHHMHKKLKSQTRY